VEFSEYEVAHVVVPKLAKVWPKSEAENTATNWTSIGVTRLDGKDTKEGL
jgi:hypothetical protein